MGNKLVQYVRMQGQIFAQDPRCVVIDKTNFCAVDDENSNAVHYAILSDDVDMLELILNIKGVDVKKKSDRYGTPLEMVLNTENIKFASLLINKIELELDQIPEEE